MSSWMDLFSPHSPLLPWNALAAFVQPISPQTSWFSPTIDVTYQGDASVEREVTSSVAGYGSQLGTLLDAVDEIGANEHGPMMERLRCVKKRVDEVKRLHADTDADRARSAMTALARSDPDGLKRLLAEFVARSPEASCRT